MDAHRGDEQTWVKFVRPYVKHDRQPESAAYVDLSARIQWHESGHFTAQRTEPDRYLLTERRPESVRDAGDREAGRVLITGTLHADDGQFVPPGTPLVAICRTEHDQALPVQLP